MGAFVRHRCDFITSHYNIVKFCRNIRISIFLQFNEHSIVDPQQCINIKGCIVAKNFSQRPSRPQARVANVQFLDIFFQAISWIFYVGLIEIVEIRFDVILTK